MTLLTAASTYALFVMSLLLVGVVVIVPLVIATLVAVATPKLGVTNVGELERTLLPEPVDVVTPVPPFATGKIPETPDVSGNPIAFDKTTEDGIPKAGVTKVGELLRTTDPLPVDVVTPVPPDATGSVPVVNAEVEVAYRAPPLVKLVRPVPPFAVPSVPPSVNVPETVMGPPVNDKPVVPPEASTLVTVPAPVIVFHDGFAPAPPVCNNCPDVPGFNGCH